MFSASLQIPNTFRLTLLTILQKQIDDFLKYGNLPTWSFCEPNASQKRIWPMDTKEVANSYKNIIYEK